MATEFDPVESAVNHYLAPVIFGGLLGIPAFCCFYQRMPTQALQVLASGEIEWLQRIIEISESRPFLSAGLCFVVGAVIARLTWEKTLDRLDQAMQYLSSPYGK